VIGVIGLAVVYSFRPPSGLGDALTMMGQGRDFYFEEPVYFALMVLSGIVSLFGVVSIVTAMKKDG
ncbi:MAG: hypothetical protein WD423_15800, partial [Rhodothermales bacterium]